ncbi:DUF4247 domain-containing protein [Ornithinibacillus sp. 179-J 7C1 HS]|uniref:DUF4247 domain-containing protein n=1 Tax=Ornithinibacillus sp. 179-J 7C1 HS TaxID=3142384 RepID=UPI0039A154BF
MCKKKLYYIGFLFLVMLLSACSSRGMDGGAITAQDLPSEPPKADITATIQNSSNYEMDDIIEANFPKVTTVEGDGSNAEVYATTRFNLSELSTLLTDTIKPDEISDVKNDQQILIYPNEFITLRESEADNSVLLIEVASDEFVRRNYSPNFLSTYFALRLLDDVLDVDDWGKRYKGTYSGMGGLGTPSRGNTTFRGGGPGTGK